MIAYRLRRHGCSGWIHCGTNSKEIAEVLKTEIDDYHSGLCIDELDSIIIQPYETTQEEIEALPEFGGW